MLAEMSETIGKSVNEQETMRSDCIQKIRAMDFKYLEDVVAKLQSETAKYDYNLIRECFKQCHGGIKLDSTTYKEMALD